MEIQDQKFYDILLEIKGRLGGIESELRGHKEAHRDIRDMIKNKEETLGEHDDRIRSIEDFKTGIKAKVGVIATIFSIVGAIGIDIIKRIVSQL